MAGGIGEPTTGRTRARSALALPEALRVAASPAVPAAHGLRARARQLDPATVLVELDGRSARVTIDPPLGTGLAGIWPFGAALARADGGRDLLAVAADQPIALLIRDGLREARARCDDDALTVSVEISDAGAALIVIRSADQPEPDAEVVLAAVIARARRRAARAPAAAGGGKDGDPLRTGEYALRRALRRTDGRVVACADDGGVLPAAAQAAAIAALCALNDEDLARELIAGVGASVAADGAHATLALGAWAGWRGSVPESTELRNASLAWMNGAMSGGDAATAAARAVAPIAAEALGERALVDRLRRIEAVAVAPALAAFAGGAGMPGADDVLGFLHGDLRIAPDALRGRIVIGPRIEAGTLELEQITMGDAVLSVCIDANAEGASIDVEQTSGGSPVTVIMEPGVPAGRLKSARVDRTAAELDATPDGSGLRVKVQLVVDRPRRLELRYEL